MVLLALVPASAALAEPPGGTEPPPVFASITDAERYDALARVSTAPGTPDGSVFAGFENNELVNSYNGNLVVTHPNGSSLPVDGERQIALSRVYNSLRVIDAQIRNSDVVTDTRKSLLVGKSWVGYGWMMHLGRVYPKAMAHPLQFLCTTGLFCYDEREWAFEEPNGTSRMFGYSWSDMFGNKDPGGQDHPILRVRYFKEPGGECHRQSRKPAWCSERPEALECGQLADQCSTSPDNIGHYEVLFEDGTSYRLEHLVPKELGLRNWIRNYDRTGWYTTQIVYRTGAIVDVKYHYRECVLTDPSPQTCDNRYPFREAIKEVSSPAHPGLRIWTEVWKDTDPGFEPGTQGMLRKFNSTGPQGQTITYEYRYVVMQDDLGDGVVDVPVLAEVLLPEIGGSPAGSITYGYAPGFPDSELADQAPGSGPLLNSITYPVGGKSTYTYGTWKCGVSKTSCVSPEVDTCPAGQRLCRGVVRRELFPESSQSTKAVWKWNRKFYAVKCGVAPTGVENYFRMVSPDGRVEESEVDSHPCGMGSPMAHDGWFRKTTVYDGDSTSQALRVTESVHDPVNPLSFPGFDQPATLVSQSTTAYMDDTNSTDSCFEGAGSSSPKTVTNTSRLRTAWSRWLLNWTSGDYMRRDGGVPMKRISHVGWDAPATIPIARLDRHVFDKYQDAFVEESTGTCTSGCSDSRYEVNYAFEGDNLGESPTGLLKRVRIGHAWQPATTRTDLTTPTYAANAPEQARDVVSELTYYPDGNLHWVRSLGGDAAPGEARREYRVELNWQDAMATSARIDGLPFESTRITPDKGFVSQTIDANGLVTNYSYDPLGRVTQFDPPGTVEQSTRVVYPDLKTLRTIRSSGTETTHLPSDPEQTFAELKFDGLGRVIERYKAMPDGSLAKQLVRYDQFSREVFVSEWMRSSDCSSPGADATWDSDDDLDADGNNDYRISGIPVCDGRPWGTTTFYGVPSASSADAGNPLRATPDGLGRSRRVVRADGTMTDLRYCGPHAEETVHGVRVSIDGTNQSRDVTTRYYHDALGRLVVVDTTPLAGELGAAVGADAIYDYDARGKLTSAALYPSNTLTGDPVEVWRSGPRPSGGQTREFTYNALGRLIDSRHPEKGWEKNRLYDVWGNLLAWQDQLGLERGYHFKNSYDVAGRPTRQEKRSGQLAGESMSGSGEHLVYADLFDSTLNSGWTEGWFKNKRFKQFGVDPLPEPQNGQWGLVPASSLGCIPAPPDGGAGNVLYFGSSCGYSGALGSPESMRRKLVGVGRDDTISLKLFRSTRESSIAGSGSKDEVAIWVLPASSGDVDSDGTPDDVDLDQRRVIYSAAEAQAVFSRWYRTPAIRPADYFSNWGNGETRDLWLFIVFTKGDTEVANLGSGVAVDDLYVGRKDVEVLSEQVWDQPVCSLGLGGDACLDTSEPADRANDRVTTIRSYQDGQNVATKYTVYRGLNGRASGVHAQIDWTGLARSTVPTDWADLNARMTYTNRGLPLELVAPSVSGVTDPRRYTNKYRRDLLVGIDQVSSGLQFFKPGSVGGIEYDSAALPTRLLFQNDTIQSVTRDTMHRVRSIASTWFGDAISSFDPGNYVYDGAGNIMSIGAQQFSHDQAGRLTNAWMLPKASDPTAAGLHKISYSYDAFGNILSQTMPQEAAIPPLGFNFTLDYDPGTESNGQSNKNRIASSGFAYDSNGNSLRFKGQQQQSVAAVWDPQNRMRGFIGGDPESGAAIAEQYVYDANGYRIIHLDKSGRPVLSIRNDKGDTLAEFVVNPSNSNPQLNKDFIYGLGQLVVERTVALMHPTMTTNSVLKSGTSYNFMLTSGTGHASYSVDISAPSGWRRQVVGIHPDGTGVFSIPEGELAPNEANFIRVRIESPTLSPYSPPVTLAYNPSITPSTANQIRTFSVSRNGGNVILRWALGQSNGKATKLYFRRADGAATYVLTPQALPTAVTELTLNSQALSSPCGVFYGTQFSVGIETGGSSETDLGSERGGEQGTQDGCGTPQPPGPPSTIVFTNAYRHLDHLGSLRIETSEGGLSSARLDFYPFGQEFATNHVGDMVGINRFAGAERDDGTGNDYMLARYNGLGISRFLSTDPGDDTYLEASQSWNKYAYVRNNPVNATDPQGQWVETAFDVAMAVVSIKQAWEAPSLANVAGAVLDIAAVVIPVVPAVGGRAIDAAQAGARVVDAAQTANKVENASDAGRAASAADGAKPSTLSPGPNAGEGVPATGPTATRGERSQVNQQGAEQGCHTCGASEPGTQSGNWVPDHQPATALNPEGGPQTLQPHCIDCSRRQGGEVKQEKDRQKKQ